MAVRYLKIALVVCVALLCMYAVQNLVNLAAVQGYVSAVVGMQKHVAYPEVIRGPRSIVRC